MTLPATAYNPSLLRHRGKLYSTFRLHDRKDWRSNLYMAELDSDFKPVSHLPIRVPISMTENSNEDARLFVFGGDLWISWTCSLHNAATFKCVVVAGIVVRNEDHWSVERYFIPPYGRHDFSGMEKNFVFFTHEEKLFCWYGVVNGEQQVLEMDGGHVTMVHKSPALPWPLGDIHGGAITRLGDGRLVHVFNSHTNGNSRRLHRYHVGVAELNPRPPFEMVRISPRPLLRGEEGVNLDGNKQAKPNVVFACGALWHDARLLIAYGWNDCKCRLMKLKVEEIGL